MRDSKSPSAGYHYFSKSDGGLAAEELRKEVGGKAAERLGLDSEPDFDQFKNLLHGLDPNSGEQITAKLVDGRISYWDITATIPKGVTIAIERGDSRVHDALWEAGRETMADLERFITTRERKGGAQENRTTGNMIWYGFEHPETRPSKQDGMPDPDRHIHFVVPNLTWDAQEEQWKAIKFRPVMDLRKWFDRRFDSRLASKLTDLGYSVETKHRDGKYYSWDIKGMPASLVKKFSRRTGEVEAVAAELGVVSATGKDKLGATSRQHKRKDMTLDDYRTYWDARTSPEEAMQVAETIQAAKTGNHFRDPTKMVETVRFALDHTFERQSVARQVDLEITAMERSMGGAKPEDILPEMVRQGVLLKSGEATTRDVLAEESRIIAFARGSRGTMRPLVQSCLPKGQSDTATLPTLGQQKGRLDESKRPEQGVDQRWLPGSGDPTRRSSDSHYQPAYSASLKADTATLSPEQQAVSHPLQSARLSLPITGSIPANLSAEQQAVVRHVLDSPDQVILIRGAAGTGKTTTTKAIISGIDRPYAMLAPTAEASRGVLRREGFEGADTVAAFLGNRDWQNRVKNGVLMVDEAGLLPIRDLSALTDVARQQNARLVMMGDPKQHKSVARHGNMFHVLQEYAGLPVAELRDIRRQRGQYKEAVAAIDRGEFTLAHDLLDDLGMIRQSGDHNKPLVDDYLDAVNRGKSVLVVAPTHAEGDEITAEIRKRLKEEGKLKDEEREFGTLLPRNLSEAQREHELEPGDVAVFFRSAGRIKAGASLAITGENSLSLGQVARKFAVYRPGKIRVSPGDVLRTTASVKDSSGRRIDNGSLLTVTGFSDAGIEVKTANGNHRTLPNDVAHITHGYVSTSHAAQGKTVDRVLIAMGSESAPAVNAEQFYVSVSRGRERATIYTDMSPAKLREAIQRQDTRKSATELMGKPYRRPERSHWLVRRARDFYHRLRDRVERATTRQQEREYHLGR